MGDADRSGENSRHTEHGRDEEDTALTDEFEIAPFELVTEETRATILATLATQQAENPYSPSIPFSDLRERAGVRDSGNFNYHLDKLQPEYVRSTDEGYALTYAGLSLVGTLRAGVGADTSRGPHVLDATCSVCGTELTASYETGLLSVVCENDHRYPQDGLPPNAVAGRSMEEIIALQTRRTQHFNELVREGVCPSCFDDIERTHHELDEPQASRVVISTCDGCGLVTSSPIGMFLLGEPAVVAFYHDHGISVDETPLWELELPVVEPSVVAEEPLRLSLSVEEDNEQLTLIADEYGRLLDSERSSVER